MMNKEDISSTHIISQKVDAKLRMYANCDQEVNENRAIQNGNLSVVKKMKPLEEEERIADISQVQIATATFTEEFKKTPVSEPSNGIMANVFIQVTQEAADSKKKFKGEVTRKGNIIASTVLLTDLEQLSKDDQVVGIERPQVLKLTDPIVTNRYAPAATATKWDGLRQKYATSQEVLIGMIDVQGFDFAHPDFMDVHGKSRFLKIWDQGCDFRKAPKKFGYGAEFNNDTGYEVLNNAILHAANVGAPATELEKQSSTVSGSHGTHVASIAAGNSGVFPAAKIIGVTIALTKADNDRRRSFYDSASVIHAIDYILAIAGEKKLPVSINISLGTNGHAHDGSDAISRWIDAELSMPGRCISLAAGNAGQEKALSERDLGFVMGRIHTKGRIAATGLSKDIFWNVVGNGKADMSENEMELWYAPQDRISVMIKPPEGEWLGPVQPNQFIENKQLKDGSYLSIYNDVYHFSNGGNYIGIYLSPNLKKMNERIPVRAGEWQVRLIGEEIRYGEFDAWIERDDPRPLGINGERQEWNFPSFLSEDSNVDNTSISSLACARYVIATGNYDEVMEGIHISSSQGPTRDKRSKPEIVAPGTNITAAKGFSSGNDLWISMTGTSMASPYACGMAAWMLSLDKDLSAAQILGIMIRTSTPLPGCDYQWKNDCGFGLINPAACLEQAQTIRAKKDVTDEY